MYTLNTFFVLYYIYQTDNSLCIKSMIEIAFNMNKIIVFVTKMYFVRYDTYFKPWVNLSWK